MQLYDFAWIPDMPKQLEALVSMIGSHHSEWGGEKLPHLYYYIHNMFVRADEQGRVWKNEENGSWCVFNTGLVYMSKEEDYSCYIYGLFQVNRMEGKQPWYFKGFYFPNHGACAQFKRLPPCPTFGLATDMIFDSTKFMSISYSTLVEKNIDLLQEYYGNDLTFDQVSSLFRKRVNAYRLLVTRNPFIAVPHFFDGYVQFLIPIGLGLYLIFREDREQDLYEATKIVDEDTMIMYSNLISLPLEPSQEDMIDCTGFFSGFSKPENQIKEIAE